MLLNHFRSYECEADRTNNNDNISLVVYKYKNSSIVIISLNTSDEVVCPRSSAPRKKGDTSIF